MTVLCLLRLPLVSPELPAFHGLLLLLQLLLLLLLRLLLVRQQQ